MKVLVAGDFVPQNRIAPIVANGEFEKAFGDVRSVVSSTDYSLVNLECPIVEENDIPIIKYGPNLKCSASVTDAIKYIGFKCTTLANNHIRDYGDMAVKKTMQTLKNNDIEFVGSGRDLDAAAKILYHKHNGKTLAVINCCENEFSSATIKKYGANPLNPIKQYQTINEARKNAEYVLVIVHGGHEHFQLPSPRMVETYRFFVDCGADAVVNHHQHCYSGYEVYKGKPIFYGLGNFCFDKPSKHTGNWTEGYMVTIDFSIDNPSFDIQPYIQCAVEPKVKLLAQNAFSSKIQELNDIIANPSKLQAEIDKYYTECENNYSNVFEPIRNRFYLAAQKKGWLPSLVSKDRKLVAFNYINCESHRDKMLFWLNK